MGNCSSLQIANDKDDVATDSRGFRLLRKPPFQSLPNSKPEMVSKEHFVAMLQDPSSYWVYARFRDQRNRTNQCFCAIDIKNTKYLLLPDYPLQTLMDNAATVLDHNLYIVGNITRTYTTHNGVQMFDPVSHAWSTKNPTEFSRRRSFAVSVNGKVYAFGGCDTLNREWGEVYDPSANTWTPVPRSQALTRCFDYGLSPLRATAVLGNNIILRGWNNAIFFDVTTSSWTPASRNLVRHWYTNGRAAVVQNLLITCHRERRKDGKYRLSIRAYDPAHDVWLTLQGIDSNFHTNAERYDFTSVDGKLVIYHMWYQQHLGFSVFDITERDQTSVRANLLCQSCFHIGKMIKKGQQISCGRRHKTLHVATFVEAVRGGDLQS